MMVTKVSLIGMASPRVFRSWLDVTMWVYGCPRCSSFECDVQFVDIEMSLLRDTVNECVLLSTFLVVKVVVVPVCVGKYFDEERHY